MEICKDGLLNSFVKPTSDGGWGLCEWIVSGMTETRIYPHTEIYQKIQDSDLAADVKALSLEQVKLICEYMPGKTFSGVLIGRGEHQQITYQPVA